MWDWLPKWAQDDLTEMRRAPTAVAILLAMGAGIGWWFTGTIYAERVEVLNQRVALLQDQIGLKSKPSQVATTSGVLSRALRSPIWPVFVGLGGVWLVVTNRRLRASRNETKTQSDRADAAVIGAERFAAVVKERDDAVKSLKIKQGEY